MDYDKIKAIATDLQELCKKHNVTIITGGQADPKLAYQFDGISIFITDGSPSRKKALDKVIGEKMHHESTLTITLNRFKNNNL
jgi:thiamine monophosphate synthase